MRILFFIILLGFSSKASSQDVMMQGWFWDYPKTAAGENWTDTLKNIATDMGDAGFTHIWLPPFSRASFGSNSNGYDPQDLYDLGEYGQGATGFGTRAQVDDVISTFASNGIESVADVVYNHRDGGKAENNGTVEGWMENLNCTKITNGDQPYPSDRVRFILPIGGATNNGAGTYYFKLASASKHPDFYDKGYKIYIETNKTGFQGLQPLMENEAGGNGGGDCGQGNETLPLGVDLLATIDNVGACGGGCGVDEYAVTLSANDYHSAADTLFVYISNSNGYTDHFIYGIWSTSAGADVQGDLRYQTYTDFTSMPSGQGAMNFSNFKPNGNPTQLNGDWDYPYFFYDYDQSVPDTRQKLTDWSQWLYDDVGIRGLRMDAVKHFAPEFVGNLLDSMHLVDQNPSMVVGEFYDFNPASLKAWVDGVKGTMDNSTKDSIDVKVFDFALRGALKNACDLFGYDARNLYNSGVVGGAAGLASEAVTFINNHDFRGQDEPVQNDPILAYAYILTNRTVGTPTVFYSDYTGTSIPNAPTQNMKPDIDKMIATYNNYMKEGTYDYMNRFGTPYTITFNDGVDNACLIYQISDGGTSMSSDAIVMINYSGDTLDVELPMSSSSSKTAGTLFREVTGKGLIPNATTNASNIIRLAIPPRSHGIWVSDITNYICDADTTVYIDSNASGLNNGTSWDDAYSDLSAAIAQSHLCPTIKQLMVKEGTYYPTITDDRSISFNLAAGTRLTGGFPSAGNPTMADYDPVANPVILSGNIGDKNDSSDNTFHIIQVSPADTIMVNGTIIGHGIANAQGGGDDSGGGISNDNILRLVNCIIENCSATNRGNAIYCGPNSTTILVDCTIKNNTGSSTEIFVDSTGKLISKGTNMIKD